MHSVRSQAVPVSLTEYVFQRKLINTFRLYIYLKFKTSGIVSSKSSVFKDLLEIRGLTSSKTIKKHLSKLIEMNWVGYNSHSTNYFLRNIQYICNNLNLDTKKVVKITISDLGNLTVFLAAVTMNGLVRNQFLYFEKVYPRNHFAAVKKSGTALQAKYSSHRLDMEVSDNTKPEYYGFSNAKLGSVLGVQYPMHQNYNPKLVPKNTLEGNKGLRFSYISPAETTLFGMNSINLSQNLKGSCFLENRLMANFMIFYCPMASSHGLGFLGILS